MTGGITYSFDTSSIIEARVRAYPPDVFASLWNNMSDLIRLKRIACAEEVLRELAAKTDELHRWAKDQEGLFVELDAPQLNEVALIVKQFPTFANPNAAKNRADPFVIALARVKGYTVVTEERRGSTDHPRIPRVCDHFNVPHRGLHAKRGLEILTGPCRLQGQSGETGGSDAGHRAGWLPALSDSRSTTLSTTKP